MTRNPRLQGWPNSLEQLCVAALQRELTHWQSKVRILGHPSARKGAAKHVRDVERELAARQEPVED